MFHYPEKKWINTVKYHFLYKVLGKTKNILKTTWLLKIKLCLKMYTLCVCVHAHLCVYQMCAGNLREQKNKLDP